MGLTSATIHTSDRIAFKRCRRKWFLGSNLGLNLTPISEKLPLWVGSGFHFALEDFHGYHRFPGPEEALLAYVAAHDKDLLPIGAIDMVDTLLGMLGYYQKWLERREQHYTLWVDGVPQVEVSFDLEMKNLSALYGFPVYYHGTLDRVVQDPYRQLLVEDYKTAASVDINKLITDPQISAYLWAAPIWYGKPFVGMLYSQFVKGYPEEPKTLVKGGFSQAKTQKTTHIIYRKALIDMYGEVPSNYLEFLNELADAESPEGDRYIRKDTVVRSPQEINSAYQHIEREAMDMIFLSLEACGDPTCAHLYPNQTRACIWDCPFRQICIAMEEGVDCTDIHGELFKDRNRTSEGAQAEWRTKIVWPEQAQ